MRKPDWLALMFSEIEAASERPFSYGKHDCCLFAANVAKAITGKDPARGLRRYKTKTGAMKLIAKHRSLEALVTSVMGEPVSPNQVRRGDMALVTVTTLEGEPDLSVGICMGTTIAVAGNGVAYVDRRYMLKGWVV